MPSPKKRKARKIKCPGNPQKLKKGSYRLHYMFLGDLVDAALHIIYENPEYKGGKLSETRPTCPSLKNDVRVLMGSFTYVNPATDKLESKPTRTIPTLTTT